MPVHCCILIFSIQQLLFNFLAACSLGSSLVITAAGGGTAVIPFLTVYAVWPASFIFLVHTWLGN